MSGKRIIIFHVRSLIYKMNRFLSEWESEPLPEHKQYRHTKKAVQITFLKSAPTDLITDSDWSIKTFFSPILFFISFSFHYRVKKIKRSLVEIEMKFSNSNFNCTRFSFRISHFHSAAAALMIDPWFEFTLWSAA